MANRSGQGKHAKHARSSCVYGCAKALERCSFPAASRPPLGDMMMNSWVRSYAGKGAEVCHAPAD